MTTTETEQTIEDLRADLVRERSLRQLTERKVACLTNELAGVRGLRQAAEDEAKIWRERYEECYEELVGQQ